MTWIVTLAADGFSSTQDIYQLGELTGYVTGVMTMAALMEPDEITLTVATTTSQGESS